MAVGNLELIKSQNITGVSSFEITNVFSADYDVYKIVVTGVEMNSSTNLRIRLIDNTDTVISTTVYDNAVLQMNSNTAFSESRSTSQSKISPFVLTASEDNNAILYVFNPFSSSSYTFFQSQMTSHNSSSNFIGRKGIYVAKTTSSCTGINFLDTGGVTINNADISIYGLASN